MSDDQMAAFACDHQTALWLASQPTVISNVAAIVDHVSRSFETETMLGFAAGLAWVALLIPAIVVGMTFPHNILSSPT
jgi:hypothetical protein